MSIFNIKKQYQNLVARAKQLDARSHVLSSQEAYYAYLKATKSKIGRILSFIPFTKPYNCRVACEQAFKKAQHNLNDIRDNHASLAPPTATAVCLQPSKSAEQAELLKCYGSPINTQGRSETLPAPSPEAMRKQLRDPWQTATRTR
jgi:hypothetical protein